MRTDRPKLRNELPMSLSADSGQEDGRREDSEAACLSSECYEMFPGNRNGTSGV